MILDEAQNTTPEQMKMFLTRIGFGSKAVITGDVTQIDLRGDRSGLDRTGAPSLGEHRRVGTFVQPQPSAMWSVIKIVGGHRRRL